MYDVCSLLKGFLQLGAPERINYSQVQVRIQLKKNKIRYARCLLHKCLAPCHTQICPSDRTFNGGPVYWRAMPSSR